MPVPFINEDFNIADFSLLRVQSISKLRKRAGFAFSRKGRVDNVFEIYK
jgi:hypothetical protein